MAFWKLEWMKCKRHGGVWFFIGLSTVLVAFQSYAGYVETDIPAQALYATGLNLFGTIVVPTIVPMFVVLSHYLDKENDGLQNFLLKGASFKEFRLYRWLFYLFFCSGLFLAELGFVFVFISFRHVLLIPIALSIGLYVVSCLFAIGLLVNLSFFIYYVSKGNEILPILLGLVGAILGTFPFGDFVWLLNPYAYLNYLFSFRSLQIYHFVIIFLVSLASFCAIIVYYCRVERVHESP